jgi:hypothetical protein
MRKPRSATKWRFRQHFLPNLELEQSMFFYVEFGVKNIYSPSHFASHPVLRCHRCSSSLARMPLVLVTLLSASSHPIVSSLPLSCCSTLWVMSSGLLTAQTMKEDDTGKGGSTVVRAAMMIPSWVDESQHV